MNDHPTTPTPPSDNPFPAADDPFAARYAELRKLGWQPSTAFLRVYREMLDAPEIWLDDDTTPGGAA